MGTERTTQKRAAVVIPLKNEARDLEGFLTALAQQLGRNDEVICIDAGSTDGSWERLCNFSGSHPQFKVFQVAGAYPGKARNLAICRTSARFIAQIDGGNWPRDNWLTNILEPLVKDRADFVMGDVGIKPIIKSFRGHRVDMGRLYGSSLFRGRHIRGRELHPPAGGASVAYKREIWELTGGFPEWLRTGEDRLFAQKLSRQNPRIVFAESAKINWEIGPTLWDFLQRHINFQYRKATLVNPSQPRWKGIILQAGFVVAAMAAAIHTAIWPLPFLIFLGAISHQGLKSIRAYRLRHGGSRKKFGWWIIVQFLAIESLVFPAKLWGTIKAILQPQKERQDRLRKKEKYLTP